MPRPSISPWLATVLLSLAACSGGGKSTGVCRETADCISGEICLDGKCVVVCTAPGQADCPPGQLCTGGVCKEPQPGALPRITDVFGNEPGDPTRVRNGLWVSGVTLANATFELTQGNTAWPLTPLSQTDLLVELLLPVDVRSGAYALVAANRSGSDQIPITLTLPELDGDTLLSRINTAAGTLLFARLPAGTSAGTVAEGDHDHDGRYALALPGSPAADGNFVPNGGFTEGVTFLAMWTVALGGAGPTASVEDVSGGVGPKAFQNGPLTRAELTSNARIPVDPNRVYRVHGRFREVATGGAGGIYLGVRAWDQNGTELGGGAWPVFAAEAVTPGTSWVHYATAFGAGTTKPLPASAATMSLALVLNADLVNAANPGNRQFQVQGLGIFGYDAPPVPVRATSAGAVTLRSDQTGVVTLSPPADATVTLPLADAYSGLAFELVNRSGYNITVITGSGELVSKFGPYGYLHVVAIADPPDNGTDWAVRSRYSTVTETFTANGTWTVPNGVVEVTALLVGGGGGGAGGRNTTSGGGGGGGGGGNVMESVIPVAPGTTWTVVVGTAGAAGGVGGNGTAGSASQMTGPGGVPIYAGAGGSGGNTTSQAYGGGSGGSGGGGCGGGGANGGSAGDDGYGNPIYIGGGGGANNGGGGGGAWQASGGTGANCRANGGAGGAVNVNRGGGGGGGGCIGGGGAGGRYAVSGAVAGTAPGGGGGGGSAQQGGAAGAGGIVVLRY